MRKKWLLPVILVLVLITCKSERTERTVHPTEANLLSDETATHIIGKNPPSDNKNKIDLRQIAREIRNSRLITEIGEAGSANSRMIIGNIEDITFHDQYIYALDEQKMNVSIYDLDGKFISSVGRAGRGPGELISPESVITHRDLLFILNNHFGVQVFKKDSLDHTYKPHDLLNYKVRPDDICINHDKLIVNTLPVSGPGSDTENDNNISVFSVDDLDNELTNFGTMYDTDSWGAKMHMSMGGIECSPHSAAIVQYLTNVGSLYGYNNEGKKLWSSKIADFNYLELIEQAGSLGPDRNNLQDNFDSVGNITYVNDQYFLIQVFNRSLLKSGENFTIKTYLAEFESGYGVFVSNELPEILSVNFEKKLYATFDTNEHPKISIFEF